MTTAPASKLHPQLSLPGGRAGPEAVLNLRPPVRGLVREETEVGRSPPFLTAGFQAQGRHYQVEGRGLNCT